MPVDDGTCGQVHRRFAQNRHDPRMSRSQKPTKPSIGNALPDLCAEPLPDDAAIEQRIRRLLADAPLPRRAALWLILIGPDDRQVPVIIPVDDTPARPSSELVDGIARLLSDLTTGPGGVAPGASVVFALERPGSSLVGPDDVAWFAALHARASAFEIRVRGVYLVAGAQVRPVTLDDAA